jgi:hypothetical protein
LPGAGPAGNIAAMAAPPVSFVTVTRDGLFFTRLLVERLRAHTRDRAYEILVVDRGSRDGTRDWLRAQPDVRLFRYGQWRTRGHGHAEAAAKAIRAARHERIVLLDPDTHPVSDDWLTDSADRLDDRHRLAGAVFVDKHVGNPHGWYIHPHFMCFFRRDWGGLIELRKLRGEDTDTGEEATIRVLAAGFEVIGHPIRLAEDFALGHPSVPSVAGGVFHAWYVSRLEHNEAEVIRESNGMVSRAGYLLPLMARLRAAYDLAY